MMFEPQRDEGMGETGKMPDFSVRRPVQVHCLSYEYQVVLVCTAFMYSLLLSLFACYCRNGSAVTVTIVLYGIEWWSKKLYASKLSVPLWHNNFLLTCIPNRL